MDRLRIPCQALTTFPENWTNPKILTSVSGMIRNYTSKGYKVVKEGVETN